MASAMRGSWLDRGPATFRMRGRVSASQARTRTAPASEAQRSRSSVRRGFPSERASLAVRAEPPVGGPKAKTTVASEEALEVEVNGALAVAVVPTTHPA